MLLELDNEIRNCFPKNSDAELFNTIMALEGKIYRALENRRTQRITLNEKNYFIKQHYGIGFKEIFKNLFQLRLPVISAKNEWRAIAKLKALGIHTQTVLGFGERGFNPAKRQSFLITAELTNVISLEDLTRDWKKNPPSFQKKNQLIKQVAAITRIMHENGINHRDCYLCHFLLDLSQPEKIYLIDLHRAQIRKKTPTRWLLKDLAGLYFSSKHIGLTQRDLWRFVCQYRQSTLSTILKEEPVFWQTVKNHGEKLYQRHEI